MACGSNQAFTSFCKKVLSEHSYSFTYCLWLLHAPLTELSGHNRNVMAWKPYFLSVPLQTTMPLLHLSLCPLWEQVTVIRLLGMYIIWSIVWIQEGGGVGGGEGGVEKARGCLHPQQPSLWVPACVRHTRQHGIFPIIVRGCFRLQNQPTSLLPDPGR